MDEVDELLLEQDLLSPTAADTTFKQLNVKGKVSPDKKKIAANTKIITSPTIVVKLKPQKGKTQNTDDKSALRDSTLEKLLNGEQTDLFDSEERSLPIITGSNQSAKIEEPDIDLYNSDELRQLIDDNTAKHEVLELNEWQNNNAKKFNTTTASPTKAIPAMEDNIDDLVEEELSRNNSDAEKEVLNIMERPKAANSFSPE